MFVENKVLAEELAANTIFNLVPKEEFQDMYPYKKARYVCSDGDKGNYIIYYVWDVQKNDLVRKRLFVPKKYKSSESQKSFAKDRVRQVNKLLSQGYHIDRKKLSERQQFQVEESEGVVLTIKQASDQFLRIKEAQQLYPRGLRFYRNTLEAFIKWLKKYRMDNIWLGDLNHKIAQQYFTHILVDRKNRAKTHNNTLGVLKTFYNECIKQEWIDCKNPFNKINKQPEEYGTKNKPFSDKQVAQIKSFLFESDPYMWKIICFIYYSFMRPSEIRRLKVSDIDLEKDLIWVSGKVSKTKKRDLIPIVPALKKVIIEMELENYPKDFYLFGAYKEPSKEKMGEGYMYKHFRKVKNEYSLDLDYTLYGFKHTAVVNWYKKEKDIRKIQKMCRHSSILMTERYLKSLGLLDDKDAVSELPEI